MNCTRITGPGGVTGFVCGVRAPRPKPCYVCGARSIALCDFELKKGKTCDRAVCALHRREVGKELDWCAGHAAGTAIAPRFSVSGVRPPPPGSSYEDHRLYAALVDDLDRTINELPPGTVVVHGDAEGVDRHAAQTARARGLIVEAHPPNPSAHGGSYAKAAMARNAYVETVDRAGCWVAPWSKGGTWDAHRRAVKAGLEVFVRQVQPDGTVVTVAQSARREAPAPGVRDPQEKWVSPLLGTRLRVRSGRLSYRGPGALPVALDVCNAQIAGGRPAPGLAFAPVEELLRPVIGIRHLVEEALLRAEKLPPHLRAAEEAKALRFEDEAWHHYRLLYLAGMRVSSGLPRPDDPAWGERYDAARRIGFKPMPEAWWALLEIASRDEGVVTFTCYCADRWRKRGHCHAITLCEVLAKLGAENLGELTPPPSVQTQLFAGIDGVKP